MSTREWGIRPGERELDFPCDRYVEVADEAWYRGTDVFAPPTTVYRWLCQLRVAPYSYDLLDNFGRRSPRSLTPGLERLEVGQRIMHVFELVEFEPEGHLTAQVAHARAVFANTAVTYLVRPGHGTATRLLVKVVFNYPWPRPAHRLLRRVHPLADTVMMRRQLHTLRQLAERDAGALTSAPAPPLGV